MSPASQPSAFDTDRSIFNLFSGSDTLQPSQYFERRGGNTADAPMRRLFSALLEDALRCFLTYVDVESTKGQRLYWEAHSWLLDPAISATAHFPFDTVCEALDLDPDFMRDGLKRWLSAHYQGAPAPRIQRKNYNNRGGMQVSVSTRERQRRRRDYRSDKRTTKSAVTGVSAIAMDGLVTEVVE